MMIIIIIIVNKNDETVFYKNMVNQKYIYEIDSNQQFEKQKRQNI